MYTKYNYTYMSMYKSLITIFNHKYSLIYLNVIIVSIITIKTSIIVHIHKFLFWLFVLSTKLTYSSSNFVLMFILYV